MLRKIGQPLRPSFVRPLRSGGVGYRRCPTRSSHVVRSASLQVDTMPVVADPLLPDMKLAVALAEVADNAYLNPSPQTIINSNEYKVGNASVAVLDEYFLEESFESLLEVNVLSASDLSPTDLDGQPEPYAEVKIQLQVPAFINPDYKISYTANKKTSQGNTINPEWNDPPLLIPIRDVPSGQLLIRLYDKDVLEDDEMGSAQVVNLGQFVDKKDGIVALELEGPGSRPGARVTLSFRLIDMKQWEARRLVKEAVSKIPDDTRKGLPAPVSDALEQLGATATWKGLRQLLGTEGQQEFSPVAFVEDKEKDTQVWLLRNVNTKTAVIAFRGSEKKLQDWLNNFQLRQMKIGTSIVQNEPITSLGEIWVHSGFLGAYGGVRPAVLALLDSIISADGQPASWRVLVTGHSLGGALATLAAYDLGYRQRELAEQQRPSLSIFTFGSPRVGNKAFAADFTAVVPLSWRFTNMLDAVTSVPTVYRGYCHVGKKVSLGPGGSPQVEAMVEEAGGFLVVELATEVIAKLAANINFAEHLMPAYALTLKKMLTSMGSKP